MGLVVDFLILLLLLFGNGSVVIRSMVQSWGMPSIFIPILYLMCLGAIFMVFHFPIKVFLGYHWEHQFGLSNQSFGQWLKDELKKMLFGGVLAAILVSVMYGLLNIAPKTWWVFTGLFWFGLTFVMAKLTPTVIVPLFYKYKSFDNDALKDRIKKMFAAAQVSLQEVYAIDFSSKTFKANAFICGLGKSRRVVLSDTLLDEYSEAEIETVVAHELGHYCHQDILKMLGINSVLIFSGLWIIDRILTQAIDYFGWQGVADVAGLPLLILVFSVFGLVTTPLTNWISCQMEVAADRYSLEQTRNPDAFVSLMRKLGEQNLAEMRPHKFIEIFFYDHPPIERRISFAKHFGQEMNA